CSRERPARDPWLHWQEKGPGRSESCDPIFQLRSTTMLLPLKQYPIANAPGHCPYKLWSAMGMTRYTPYSGAEPAVGQPCTLRFADASVLLDWEFRNRSGSTQLDTSELQDYRDVVCNGCKRRNAGLVLYCFM